MNRREAERNLDLIRRLMERAGGGSDIPASASLVAAGCALAGSLVSGDFVPENSQKLLAVWSGVAAIALAQFAGLTLFGARRRGEAALSRSTWAAFSAVLPGLAAGAILTAALPADLWPGVWMLCYGVAVHGVGYFAGWRATLTGALFIACGAASIFALRSHGVAMMAAAFGGLHALFGALLLVQRKENHESVLFDAVEDR